MAGNISVPTQMTSINILDNGKGICNVTYPRKGNISVILEVRRYIVVFFKLSNILRPY